MKKIEPKDRIYWNEGVTRGEVVRAMTDRRPSPLYRQGPRRLLVLSAALVMTALALTVFITHIHFRIYAEVILTVLGLCLFAFLRQAVRLVSEAPDELLDERQIALRNANYTAAYRNVIQLTVVYGVLLALITPGGWLHALAGDRFWTGIALSYLLCSASLPSMILAWNMPSEVQDEPSDESPAGTP